MDSTKKKGDKWELIAIKYLQGKWYNLIDTNFKFSIFWEIDLICNKWWITYFIEVKYRSSDKFWLWEESITKRKLLKLKKTIEFYVVKNNLDFEKIRFDVISIIKTKDSFHITHYKNLELW